MQDLSCDCEPGAKTVMRFKSTAAGGALALAPVNGY